MNQDAQDALALQFAQIACDAGDIVMTRPRAATHKPDGSPVTVADTDAELLIRERLRQLLPDVPVIAEESFDGNAPPQIPRSFLLVDPLDGTRDFVAGGDEFTVNIALIEDGVPIVGSVYAPARKRLYLAGARAFALDIEPGHTISTSALRPLATRPYPAQGLHALMSRSHLDPNTQALVDRLGARTRQQIGSSLKFCLLADGEADVYPRLAPTMEWDTAAGHAVLATAGGCVLTIDGASLRYGKLGFRNSNFIAWGREPLRV